MTERKVKFWPQRMHQGPYVSLTPTGLRICAAAAQVFAQFLGKALSVEVLPDSGSILVRLDPQGWCSIRVFPRRDKDHATTLRFGPEPGLHRFLRAELNIPDDRWIYFEPLPINHREIRLEPRKVIYPQYQRVRSSEPAS